MAALVGLRWVAAAPDDVTADVIVTYARGVVEAIESEQPELAAWAVESADRYRYDRALRRERATAAEARRALAAALELLAAVGEDVDAGLLAWAAGQPHAERTPGRHLADVEALCWAAVEALDPGARARPT